MKTETKPYNAFCQKDGTLNCWEVANVLSDYNDRHTLRKSVEEDIKAGCFICLAYFNFDRTAILVEIYKDKHAHCALFTKRTLAKLTVQGEWEKWFPEIVFDEEERSIIVDALTSIADGYWEDLEEHLCNESNCDPPNACATNERQR